MRWEDLEQSQNVEDRRGEGGYVGGGGGGFGLPIGGGGFGLGTLIMTGPNSNSASGFSRVDEGLLQLNKSSGDAISGSLIVGDDAGGRARTDPGPRG